MGIKVSRKIEAIRKNFELINAIRRCHTGDKKQLSKVLDVSWPTVNTSIKEVLLDETQPVILDPSDKYIIRNDFGYFVGIAVGGAETKLSIMDFSLNPINCECLTNFDINKEVPPRFHIANDKYKDVIACFKTPEYSEDISLLCNNLLRYTVKYFEESKQMDLLGVGFTFPGVFGNTTNNTYEVGFCPNLSRLVGVSLLELFDNNLLKTLNDNKISFTICHDTEALTIFEKEQLYEEDSRYRLYRDKPNVACIYLGLGLGMGVIINNSLLHGSCNSVGEIGHLLAPEAIFDDLDLTFAELEEKKQITNCSDEKDYSCYCGIKNCLEHQIRVNVFNSYDQQEYGFNTSEDNLANFEKDHPYRYKVFKKYISYLMNLVINLLNVDVIIFAGRIFNKISALRYEADRIKIASALSSSANSCKIIFGTNRADVVALGGAICSYFSLGFSNTSVSTDKTLYISWPKTTAEN